MAADYLLELDGIKGESNDKKHKDAIDIQSYSWGVTQQGSVSAGGGSPNAGKVSFQDIHFTAPVSKASPQLFLACATGKHIAKATLFGEQNNGTLLKVTLSDVLISSYKSADSEIERGNPLDEFSFNFAKIEFEVRGERAGYDIKSAKSV